MIKLGTKKIDWIFAAQPAEFTLDELRAKIDQYETIYGVRPNVVELDQATYREALALVLTSYRDVTLEDFNSSEFTCWGVDIVCQSDTKGGK